MKHCKTISFILLVIHFKRPHTVKPYYWAVNCANLIKVYLHSNKRFATRVNGRMLLFSFLSIHYINYAIVYYISFNRFNKCGSVVPQKAVLLFFWLLVNNEYTIVIIEYTLRTSRSTHTCNCKLGCFNRKN